MGSEVAKVIEANKGKEKAVRKILRSRLEIPEYVTFVSITTFLLFRRSVHNFVSNITFENSAVICTKGGAM